MENFEGYVGIHLWNGQLVDDVIFALLICQFVAFSFVFRFNYKLFFRMRREAFFQKERMNLFDVETNGKQEIFFRTFMSFQFLFLSTIAMVVFGQTYGLVHYADWQSVLRMTVYAFGLLLVFYQFKQACYRTLGVIFAEPEKYKLWKTSYNAIMGIWGVSLYLPVFWLVVISKYELIPVIMLSILYILCRFVIIYKTVRIFHKKSTGILYLCLYLCAQEILPLIFAYEGLIYLYNVIETSTLWH